MTMAHLKTLLPIGDASAVDRTDQLWFALDGRHGGQQEGEEEGDSNLLFGINQPSLHSVDQ